LIRALPGITDLGIEKLPSQVCVWSQGQGPFKTYCVFPMNHASNVLRQIAPRVPRFLRNYLAEPPGNLVYGTNDSEVIWRGLPLVFPVVKAASDAATECFEIGLLPPLGRTKPPPDELLAQFRNRSDLACYDWEITQDRVVEAQRVYQVIDMIHLRRMAGTNEPGFRWFNEAAPRLGNTVTEVSIISRADLKVIRKSHVGFTGFELATLLRWIESPAFPLGYEPRPSVRTKKHSTVPDSKSRR